MIQNHHDVDVDVVEIHRTKVRLRKNCRYSILIAEHSELLRFRCYWLSSWWWRWWMNLSLSIHTQQTKDKKKIDWPLSTNHEERCEDRQARNKGSTTLIDLTAKEEETVVSLEWTPSFTYRLTPIVRPTLVPRRIFRAEHSEEHALTDAKFFVHFVFHKFVDEYLTLLNRLLIRVVSVGALSKFFDATHASFNRYILRDLPTIGTQGKNSALTILSGPPYIHRAPVPTTVVVRPWFNSKNDDKVQQSINGKNPSELGPFLPRFFAWPILARKPWWHFFLVVVLVVVLSFFIHHHGTHQAATTFWVVM